MRGENSEQELTEIQKEIIEKVEEVAEKTGNYRIFRSDYEEYVEENGDYSYFPKYGKIKYYFYNFKNLRRESDKLKE